MKYFGTDGIRGVPNKKLTAQFLLKLGKALKALTSEDVILATDTRVSKDMVAYSLAAGAMSNGLNVLFVGILSTPALIYSSYHNKKIGVMITASHNPYYDNGVKIVKNGYKLQKDEEEMIEKIMDEDNSYDGQIGKLIYYDKSFYDYLDFLERKIVKTDLKIVIDCANGATTYLAEKIFNKVTDNLIIIGNKPNGYNINDNCGSTHLEALQKTIINKKYDIGFAFDGDGDRLICVDKFGNIIDGDKIIYFLAKYYKANHKLNNNQVVLTKMSNLGLVKALEALNISVLETDVGDKNVYEALKVNNLSLGGENSGHIIVSDLFHTGDGILTALEIIKILSLTGTNIYDWFFDLEMYADETINLKVNDKKKIMEYKQLFSYVDSIKKKLNNDCKIVIRPSGTEDVVRITVMAKDSKTVKKYTDELANIIRGYNL